MSYSVYYTAQLRNDATGKVVEQKIVYQTQLKRANDINEFGLRHR